MDQDQEPKSLPVVLEGYPDEVLSSWLRRHAAYYAVSEAALIAWLGLRVSNLRTVDLSQRLGDHLGPVSQRTCGRMPLASMASTKGWITPKPLIRRATFRTRRSRVRLRQASSPSVPTLPVHDR